MASANRGNHENRLDETPQSRSTDTPPTAPIVHVLTLSPDDLVLDFGAGSGRFTLPVAKRLEELKGMGHGKAERLLLGGQRGQNRSCQTQ